MLGRTRVSGKMDVGRLSAALARPGMDTRIWVSAAVAMGEAQVDPKFGVFVDVTLIPSGEEYTARVPADYAGNGFGFYAKIHKDDDLVVVVPYGDAAEGVVVVARLWTAADLPPALAQSSPEDLILVVEKDKNLRVAVQGQGKVFVETAGQTVSVKTNGGKVLLDSGGGDVMLGADGLLVQDGVVHGTGLDTFTGAPYYILGNTSAVVKAKK
jgi:hypothetical protein